MALKDDLISGFLQKVTKKQDLELCNQGSSKARLFDEPSINLKEDKKNIGTNKESKSGTESGANIDTNWVHNKVHRFDSYGFLALSGVRRRVLMTIYRFCSASKNFQTPRLSIENIAHGCNAIANTVKKTLQRLEKEGFIKRVGYKSGRSGWTVYALNKNVCKEIGLQLDIVKCL